MAVSEMYLHVICCYLIPIGDIEILSLEFLIYWNVSTTFLDQNQITWPKNITFF